MLGGMPTQQSLFGGGDGKMPVPIGMAFPQKRGSQKNPLRPLWMAGCGILYAACVVENNHSLGQRDKRFKWRGRWLFGSTNKCSTLCGYRKDQFSALDLGFIARQHLDVIAICEFG